MTEEKFVRLVPPTPCYSCHHLNEQEGWTVVLSSKIQDQSNVTFPPPKTLGPFSKLSAETIFARMIMDGATPTNTGGR